MSDTRVVLVKPGDVLIFGNVGEWGDEATAAARTLKDALGLAHVVAFESDIDLAAVSRALELNSGDRK